MKHQTKYQIDMIAQMIDLMEAIDNVAETMSMSPCDVWFTKSQVSKNLELTPYYAAKLLNCLVDNNVILKRGNRYQIIVESPLLMVLSNLTRGY